MVDPTFPGGSTPGQTDTVQKSPPPLDDSPIAYIQILERRISQRDADIGMLRAEVEGLKGGAAKATTSRSRSGRRRTRRRLFGQPCQLQEHRVSAQDRMDPPLERGRGKEIVPTQKRTPSPRYRSKGGRSWSLHTLGPSEESSASTGRSKRSRQGDSQRPEPSQNDPSRVRSKIVDGRPQQRTDMREDRITNRQAATPEVQTRQGPKSIAVVRDERTGRRHVYRANRPRTRRSPDREVIRRPEGSMHSRLGNQPQYEQTVKRAHPADQELRRGRDHRMKQLGISPFVPEIDAEVPPHGFHLRSLLSSILALPRRTPT